MNILIVDDIPTNLKLLRIVLEAEGYRVLSAADGFEALAIMEHESIDVVISDILMPRMDGYRLCYELRRSERFHPIPFIIYTATYTSPADEKVAFDLSADKFIRKPASGQVILEALREVTTNPKYKQARRFEPPPELEIMKEYSERLVAKLEEKNTELMTRNKELRESEERFRKLNEELELRVVKRTEELTTANRELEAFSYSVSHDLQGPLRHILGFAGMLHKEASPLLNEKSQRYLEVISESVMRMSELIRDLLAFSRIGRTELQMQEISLDEVVKKSLQDLKNEVKERSVAWKIGSLGSVLGDPSMLRQVLVNLIGNALKFTRTRAQAEIEIGCISGKEDERVIFVRDNGVGFDMTCAEKLFGVFQRLHSNEEFEGTGIGLANVQRIIQRHGGRVWAESVVDGGATFYFSLLKQPPPAS